MKKPSHKLFAATFVIGSSLTGIQSAIAQSTTAGTTISNTATATYSDGSTTYNSTSNTVIVNVAEVPGVRVDAGTPTNTTPTTGDIVFVDFIITNVGNDPTQFFIPGTVTFSNPTHFSIPTGSRPQIVSVNGTALGTPIDVPATGERTGVLLSSHPTGGSIAPNPGGGSTVGTVTVRVPVQVGVSAPPNATTTVSLGNTATPDDQNVDRASDIDANDVYTIDNADTVTNETAGVITQQSEAMDTSATITVGARLQAFAAILKAVSNYSNNNTPAVLSDDTLSYSFALRVDNPTGIPGLAASDLHPTTLNLNGGTNNAERVLVSDAIPTGTILSTTIPTAPTGWTVVYTVSPLSIPAHRANWVTTQPAIADITRVGFMRSDSTPVPKGTTVTGFSFSVNPLSTFTGGKILNMAQMFGQSQPGTPVPGTPTQIVYDESGDQEANNQLNDGNPDPTSGGADNTGLGIDDGVADAGDGEDDGTGNTPTDTSNTNQGSPEDFDGGEAVPFTIAATPLNGPNGRPTAVNTTNNDDFTNKSIVLPANTDPATPLTDTQTPATTFTNTIQNTSGGIQTISLLPIPSGTPSELPTGTIVTITAGSDVAVYRYDGAQFVFQPADSSGTGATDPVKLVDIPANNNAPGGADEVNYTVSINLPDGVGQNRGFPVSIVAFVDQNNDGASLNEPGNITIDRLYTGYVNLEKDARIIEINPTTGVETEVVAFTKTQATLSAAARPGRIIEYRIRYNNVSTLAPNNSGSIGLPANTLTITENGSAAPNNWFTSTDDSVGATIPGSAIVSAGSISGTSSGGDIQIYVNTIPTVAPQASGTFTFRRRIN